MDVLVACLRRPYPQRRESVGADLEEPVVGGRDVVGEVYRFSQSLVV